MLKRILLLLIILVPFINVKAIENENLKITKFEIIGYEINFDINKNEYTINIPNIINKLNIIVEGENIEVIGDGVVDITNTDSLQVIVKNDTLEKKYTINLVREDMVNGNGNNITFNIENFDLTAIILLIISIILLIVTLILVIILKKKREKEIELL